MNLLRTENFIYFVQEEGSKLIKIGFTSNVSNRIQSLQTACPYPLRLLKAVRGTLSREKAIHEQFNDERIRPDGEWFYPAPALLEFIEKAEDVLLPPSTKPIKWIQPERKQAPPIDLSWINEDLPYEQILATGKQNGLKLVWRCRHTHREILVGGTALNLKQEIKCLAIGRYLRIKDFYEDVAKCFNFNSKQPGQWFAKRVQRGKLLYKDMLQLAALLEIDGKWRKIVYV